MPTTLNVLYAADENYAPFLGVSMYSLFQNNTAMEHIRVYAVLDNVSEENKQQEENGVRTEDNPNENINEIKEGEL